MGCSQAHIEEGRGFKAPSDCRCYGAVMKTYAALKGDQLPDYIAFEAARRVYLFHHPEDTLDHAGLIVERWLHQERLQ